MNQPQETRSVVVMAKKPVPGRVKTRLINELTAEQASAVHAAMLGCVLDRLGAHLPGRRYLALDGLPDKHLEKKRDLGGVIIAEDWALIDQGQGGLGDRLDHVWRTIGGGTAVFLGSTARMYPLIR